MNNRKKHLIYIRLLIAGGLLMTTMPLLLKEYTNIPDFVRGFLIGMGLTFEIAGLVLINKRRKSEATCCQ